MLLGLLFGYSTLFCGFLFYVHAVNRDGWGTFTWGGFTVLSAAALTIILVGNN